MTRPSGSRLTAAQRRATGLVRVDVWLPLETARELATLCEREERETGVPALRARTQAIARAIGEAVRR